MFNGTVPFDARRVLVPEVLRWGVKDVYIACSGNLTIERCFVGTPVTLHSNDVRLYTCAMAAFFAGKPLRLEIAEKFQEELAWLGPFMADDAGRLASMLIWSDLARPYLKRDRNAYYARMVKGYRAQYPAMHEKIVAKLRASQLKIGSLFAGDCLEHIRGAPRDAAVLAFPPIIRGDYEAMWRDLETVFVWEEPKYKLFGPEELKEMVRLLLDRPYWALLTPTTFDDLAPFLRGLIQTTNRAVPWNAYMAGEGKARLVSPAQKTEACRWPPLGAEERLQGPLSLVELTGGEFSALRSQYMNAHIRPGSPALAVGVLANGKLVGCYAVSEQRFALGVGVIPQPAIYLLSDFPVAPTVHRRLAKLILYAALSRESRLMFERRMSRPVLGIITTAFSQKPVSMKYRGLFQLLARKENQTADGHGGEDHAAQRYMLNYGAPLGERDLAQALVEWEKRDAAASDGRAA